MKSMISHLHDLRLAKWKSLGEVLSKADVQHIVVERIGHHFYNLAKTVRSE
jgi:hypothetical protein